MVYDVFALRDVCVGFGAVVVEQNVQSAVRNFRSLSTSRNVPFSDLELYRIATYDTKIGLIEGFPVPELIVRGADILREEVDSCETSKS